MYSGYVRTVEEENWLRHEAREEQTTAEEIPGFHQRKGGTLTFLLVRICYSVTCTLVGFLESC